MRKIWIITIAAAGLVFFASGWYLYMRFLRKAVQTERKVFLYHPTNDQRVNNRFVVRGGLSFPSEGKPSLEVVSSNLFVTNLLPLHLFSNQISNEIILSDQGLYFLRIGLDEVSQNLFSGSVSIYVTNRIKKKVKVVIKKKETAKEKKRREEWERKRKEELERKRKEEEKRREEKKKKEILKKITNEVERIKKEQELSVNNLEEVELEEQRAKAAEVSNETKKLEMELSQKMILLSNSNVSLLQKKKAEEELRRLEREKKRKEEELKRQAEELKKKEEIVQEKQIEDDFYVFDTLNQLKEQESEATTEEQTIETNRIHTELTNVQIQLTNSVSTQAMQTAEVNRTKLSETNQIPEKKEVKKTPKSKADRIKALILKKRGFSKINLKIKDVEMRYRLFINGNLIKILSGGEHFQAEVIAGEKYDVVLIKEKDQRPVFRRLIEAKRDQSYEIDYVPTGKVIVDIRNLNLEAVLKVDNKEVARIPRLKGKESFVKELELTSYQKHRIDIVSPAQELLYRRFIDPIESFSNRVDLDMGPKVRNLYFALRALEGGPTLSLGLNVHWLNVLETWITGGIFFYDPLFYSANFDLIYYFYRPKQSYLKIGSDLFLNYYIANAGKTLYALSGGLGLVVRYDWFYVFLKLRYSLIDNAFHPMVGFGLSF